MQLTTHDRKQMDTLLLRLALFAQQRSDTVLAQYCTQAELALAHSGDGRLWNLSGTIGEHFQSHHYEPIGLPQEMVEILSAPHRRILEQDVDLSAKIRIHPASQGLGDCPLCRLGEPGDFLTVGHAFSLTFGYWMDTLLAKSGEARIRFRKGEAVIVLCSNDLSTFIFRLGTITQVDNRMIDLPQYCEVRLHDGSETSWHTVDGLCPLQKRTAIKAALDAHHIVIRRPDPVFSNSL